MTLRGKGNGIGLIRAGSVLMAAGGLLILAGSIMGVEWDGGTPSILSAMAGLIILCIGLGAVMIGSRRAGFH